MCAYCASGPMLPKTIRPEVPKVDIPQAVPLRPSEADWFPHVFHLSFYFLPIYTLDVNCRRALGRAPKAIWGRLVAVRSQTEISVSVNFDLSPLSIKINSSRSSSFQGKFDGCSVRGMQMSKRIRMPKSCAAYYSCFFLDSSVLLADHSQSGDHFG